MFFGQVISRTSRRKPHRHFWKNGFQKSSTLISPNLPKIIFWTPQNLQILNPKILQRRSLPKTNISINRSHSHEPQDLINISGIPYFHSENFPIHDFPGGETVTADGGISGHPPPSHLPPPGKNIPVRETLTVDLTHPISG